MQSTKGRLTLHFLPGYAPDLNPDELVGSHVKRTGVARTPLRKGERLRDKIEAQLATIKTQGAAPGTTAGAVFLPGAERPLYYRLLSKLALRPNNASAARITRSWNAGSSGSPTGRPGGAAVHNARGGRVFSACARTEASATVEKPHASRLWASARTARVQSGQTGLSRTESIRSCRSCPSICSTDCSISAGSVDPITARAKTGRNCCHGCFSSHPASDLSQARLCIFSLSRRRDQTMRGTAIAGRRSGIIRCWKTILLAAPSLWATPTPSPTCLPGVGSIASPAS